MAFTAEPPGAGSPWAKRCLDMATTRQRDASNHSIISIESSFEKSNKEDFTMSLLSEPRVKPDSQVCIVARVALRHAWLVRDVSGLCSFQPALRIQITAAGKTRSFGSSKVLERVLGGA
jgi:hypothetical protein